MSVEEVLVGLQNAIARGQALENAMNSLVLAGYNPQEVQEAAKQINLGIINNIPSENSESPKNNQLPEPTSTYKPLPTENVQQAFAAENETNEIIETSKKKKFPKWLLVTIIVCALIVLGAVIISIVGLKIIGSAK